jgi:hypothetical protein
MTAPDAATLAAPSRLRPYQEIAVDAIRAVFRSGRRRVVFVLPTGGGNSIVFCYDRGVLYWAGGDIDKLRLIAKARDYKTGWAWRQHQAWLRQSSSR